MDTWHSIVLGVVLAQKSRVQGLPILWALLPLVGVILLAALVIAVLQRWRKRQESEPASNDQLSHFRTLYEEGELTDEEYARIRTKLGRQLQQELNLPPAPPAEPQPQASPMPEPAENGIKPSEPPSLGQEHNP